MMDNFIHQYEWQTFLQLSLTTFNQVGHLRRSISQKLP